MVKLLYPYDGNATDAQVLGWAHDAYANGVIPMAPHDIEHAVEMLQDAGLLTVPRRWYFIGPGESHYNDE